MAQLSGKLTKAFYGLYKARIKEEYQEHIKDRTHCEKYCQYTIAYQRNLPIVEAEIAKIHWLNLALENLAEWVKKLPTSMLKYIVSWIFHSPKKQ